MKSDQMICSYSNKYDVIGNVSTTELGAIIRRREIFINQLIGKIIGNRHGAELQDSRCLTTDMDLLVVVHLLFSIIVIDAKDFLRTGSGSDINIPENTSDEDGSDVVALVIVEHNQNSKEKISSTLLDSNYGVDGNLKVWSELSDSSETDSSGDTNSDEYPDSESYDTDSESNYYHPEDYEENMSTEVATLSESQPAILRKAWKSCLKKAAKVCKKACVATYKNACDGSSCKSKFKKSMKKGCKRYCKDSFV